LHFTNLHSEHVEVEKLLTVFNR